MASGQGQMRALGTSGASSWDCCYCFPWCWLESSEGVITQRQGLTGRSLTSGLFSSNKRPVSWEVLSGTQQPSFTPGQRPCAHRRPLQGRPMALPHEHLCLWGGAPLSQLQVALSMFLWPLGPALQVSYGHSPALLGTEGLRASQGPLGPFQSPGFSLGPSEPGPVPRSASYLLQVKRSAASSHLPYLSPALPK